MIRRKCVNKWIRNMEARVKRKHDLYHGLEGDNEKLKTVKF